MEEAAQQEAPQQMLAPFPAPPPFYKHFTKQNCSHLRQLRKDAHTPPTPSQANSTDPNGPSNKDLDIASLPPELRYQIPPRPPLTDELTVFGIPTSLSNKEPTLADRGTEQLYPDHPSVHQNPQPQLIALARSLLTTFLSLLGVLSQNPDLYDERVETLRAIVENMHELINGYRPHQARETLILMMEERIERTREEIRRIGEGRGKVEEILKDLKADAEGLGGGEAPAERNAGVDRGDGQEIESKQRSAWAALEQEMGGE